VISVLGLVPIRPEIWELYRTTKQVEVVNSNSHEKPNVLMFYCRGYIVGFGLVTEIVQGTPFEIWIEAGDKIGVSRKKFMALMSRPRVTLIYFKFVVILREGVPWPKGFSVPYGGLRGRHSIPSVAWASQFVFPAPSTTKHYGGNALAFFWLSQYPMSIFCAGNRSAFGKALSLQPTGCGFDPGREHSFL